MHVFGHSGTWTRQPVPGLARSTVEARRSAPGAGSRPAHSAWLIARGLGALALLAVGAVHLQTYFGLYSAIPTIGTLFVLNFVGATAMGLGLLAPTEHLLGRRGRAAVALLTLGGIGLAVTAFVFLLVSEHTPLFGFMEPGYDPTAILASRVAEAATVLLLGTYLVARFVTKAPVRRW
jgi:hypothetical protein